MKSVLTDFSFKIMSFYKKYQVELISSFIGAFIFILVYGYKVLNPVNITWMYHGLHPDFTQHYLGWKGFRASDWTFPFGLMDSLTYPDKVSIIFTDSIPLFAIVFKIFSPFLPESFQYFGFWGILTYALNGFFAAKIIHRYIDSHLNIILGSLFFILSFQMLERMYFHTALATHWLILLPIYMILNRRKLSTKKKIIMSGLVGALCPLIHSYYILFDGIILAGFALAILTDKEGKEENVKKRIITALFSFVAFVLTGLFTLYILGAFESGIVSIGGNVEGYGLDLNAFFNEMDSGYFPSIFNYNKGHRIYYLGAGMIILTFSSLFHIIKGHDLEYFRQRKYTVITMVFVFIFAFIVACSPSVTLNGIQLIHYSLPAFIMKIWNVFKNTARTSWVCIYVIYIFAICADRKFIRKETKTGILIFTFMIQFLDMSPFLIERHGTIITESNVKEFDPHLNAEYLDELINSHGIEHIVLGPLYDMGDFKFLTGYAMSRGLTTNVFRLARGSEKDNEAEFRKALAEPDEKSLYIITAENELYTTEGPGINWLNTGEYIIGIVGEY